MIQFDYIETFTVHLSYLYLIFNLGIKIHGKINIMH